MTKEELYCNDCKDYTPHLVGESKTCSRCGSIYDDNRTRYVITGPETDKDTIRAANELLEKDPEAIIISEEVALRHRVKNFQKFPVIGEAKIHRNQLCPCGSGKKYKKCCININ